MARGQEQKTKKGAPFSVRFTEPTERLIDAEARRLRRSKSAIVEAFAEETARTRRFPGIGFRGDDTRRRAWVIGSGLDVWELCQLLEDLGSAERVVSEMQLSERQVRLASAYRDEFHEEIEQALEENRRSTAELRELYPFVQLETARR